MSAASTNPVLRVEGLGFAHPGQPALFDSCWFSLPSGLTLLQGDMSSGKTTLLHLLAGRLSGAGSRVLQGVSFEQNPQAYGQRVCWFDPRDPVFDGMTPQGLMLALRARHPTIDEAGWQGHVTAFGLAEHAAKPLYALSTGSRRKAALAVALASGCALTLLDEPAGGLDGPSLGHLRQALLQLSREQGRAVVLVCSHGLDDLPLAQTLTLPLR